MRIGSNEARLRLAAAQHTEAQLRELVSILLVQGETLFASRSWRIGSAVTRILVAGARLFGCTPGIAQTAQYWRDIVDAHYDQLLRQRVLLDQLCEPLDECQNMDVALTRLWQHTGEERVLRGPT